MPSKDKRIDAYIAKSSEFAQPILTYLREVVHEGCPEVQETIKWGMPHFEHKGIMCGMASFKEHCAFGFWKGSLIIDPKEIKSVDAMGQFGRITSLKDLPAKKTLVGYVKKAAELNEAGIKTPARVKQRTKTKELSVPDYFIAAIKKNKKALATFDGFPYSKKKDYVEWITGAKTGETRDRRTKTAIEWMSEGKARHWKYENC